MSGPPIPHHALILRDAIALLTPHAYHSAPSGAAGPLRPINTTSAYFAPRFCTSCLRPLGDADTFLDALSLLDHSTPRQLHWRRLLELMPPSPEPDPAALPLPDFRRFGPCCTRYIIGPQQHNVRDTLSTFLFLTNSTVPNPPSSLYATAGRPRIRSAAAPPEEAFPLSDFTLQAAEAALLPTVPAP